MHKNAKTDHRACYRAGHRPTHRADQGAGFRASLRIVLRVGRWVDLRRTGLPAASRHTVPTRYNNLAPLRYVRFLTKRPSNYSCTEPDEITFSFTGCCLNTSPTWRPLANKTPPKPPSAKRKARLPSNRPFPCSYARFDQPGQREGSAHIHYIVETAVWAVLSTHNGSSLSRGPRGRIRRWLLVAGWHR
jgi:hypothetical protein